ncbi:response regulator [Enemella sp. A6]|uniref:response regulator n=1 Tax=Enemella sp. A6 TaxID=3440152 RepID=UPI003EB852B0
MITIALADDEPLFTSGLTMILEAQPDMRVLWQAGDGAEAIRRHDEEQPDVLLLDIRMPTLDGLEATKRLVTAETSSKIIILTTFDTDEYVLTAIESGASGFLVKNTPPEQLVTAIRTVHHGDAVISPGATRKLFATFRREPRTAMSVTPTEVRLAALITPRERDVLTLIARGLTNQEICDELWLSMPTIKTYVGNLLAKTQSRDRVQLALFALRTGIANLGS